MKRPLALAAAAAVGLIPALAPGVGAVPPALVQENVRHVANVPGSTGGHVVAEGDRLYVGAYGLGMRIFDISDPADPVEIGSYFPGPQDQSDLGLRADTVPDAAVLDGRHIATLAGTGRAQGTQQTEFLDVTDPADPVLLHRFRGASEGEAHNGDIVDDRRLWLPSGGRTGDMLRIYDLDPLLETPPAAPTRLFAANINTLWLSSPYRGDKPTGPNPTHIHDIEVYTDHEVLLLEEEWVDQDGDEIPDPTYATKDIAFYAASQNYPLTVGGVQTTPNESAVYIVDISDPSSPVIMNKIPAQDGHRYLHEVQLLDGDPSIMFTSDEDLHNGCDAGGVYSFRLSEDLTEATFLDSWFNGTGTPAPACSAHVFSSNEDFVFMGSYNAGLQVIDFSDPANLTRAGQYIAPGQNSWGALYYRGYVYVGDFGPRGLDVFEFIPNPDAAGLLKAPSPQARMLATATEAATCDPASPANGVETLIVPIPEDKRDGTATIRAVTGNADPVEELDAYFLDEDCGFISSLREDSGGVQEGPIDKDAAVALVTLDRGTADHVYVKIT
jgi:hypothetical protein